MKMEAKPIKSNDMIKLIEQTIRRTGFDENFIRTAKFHLEVITSKAEKAIDHTDRDAYGQLLMTRFFFDMLELYPVTKFKSKIFEYSDSPLPILPAEVFGSEPISAYRKISFFQCLQVGDVLDCRVSLVLPTMYHLRVIHKYGSIRILDDLCITVAMFKNESELLVLEQELLPCELIRVSVSSFSRNEEELVIFVSCNTENLQQEHILKLGRISEEHLPPYILDPPSHSTSTYSEYLKKLPGFHNLAVLNNVFEDFGIDPRGFFSFYPKCESLSPKDRASLSKELNVYTIKKLTLLLENGDYSKALECVQNVIGTTPTEHLEKTVTEENKFYLIKFFEIRGKIYSEICKEKHKVSDKALVDWKFANSLNPSDHCTIQDLPNLLFLQANRLYRKKDYKEAAVFAEASVKLNKNNVEAVKLLKYLKSTHPEAFLNLEKESLLSLQEKKKELVSELEKVHLTTGR